MDFSSYYSQKLNNAFYFVKGRVTLYAILKSLGVKKGDEVIIQAFTCLAVPNPIIWLGAKPIFVDIDPKTFNIDPFKIEEKITPKTKAIIVQHTYGVPAEMDKITEIAKKHNLYVIEDSCHAIGSKYKEKMTGFMGDAAFFSFGWGKPITAGIGGCAVINNLEIRKEMEKIYEQFKEPSLKESIWLKIQYLFYSLFLTPSLFWSIRSVYRFLSKMKIIGGTFLEEEIEHRMPIGFMKKMPKGLKKIVIKELEEIDSLIGHRKWVVSNYERKLSEIGIRTQGVPEYIKPVYLRYPLLVKDKNRILEEAKKKKIEIGDWYSTVVHPLKEKKLESIGYKMGMCPIAEEVAQRLVHLPTYKKVDERYILRVIEFLKEKTYS
ncbi:MAG: DegT/DnrJ/EryC1/StrS family aminotransferase [Minisyncoccales bacterium]